MKHVKKTKQLALATETVRALDKDQLGVVAGGLGSWMLPCGSNGLKICRQ